MSLDFQDFLGFSIRQYFLPSFEVSLRGERCYFGTLFEQALLVFMPTVATEYSETREATCAQNQVAFFCGKSGSGPVAQLVRAHA